MGYRLSKIYTRTGDNGTTGLGNGQRVDKDSIRIEAIGTLDELNSQLGIVLTHDIPSDIRQCLTQIQHALFDLGGELSIPGHCIIKPEHPKQLETWLDKYNTELPPLKEFILPGGTPAAAHCHLARAVCRRAERCVTTLQRQEPVNSESLAYLNRLSDLLFVLARALARSDNNQEVFWQPGGFKNS